MPKFSKPLLKWVGGKTQIVEKVIAEFPEEMNNYREMFLGGGSILLAFLTQVNNGAIKVNHVFAYDVNEALIYVYKNIQTNHEELFNELQILIRDFNGCGEGKLNRTPQNIKEALISKENYYYWIRAAYNACDKKTIMGSAMFVFLNKTCFRGVFRVGPNGFNVPYGHYKKPEIINKEHLNEIHELIQGVSFECRDFTESFAMVESNDFVYLDPPYAPETSTSFVKYTENGFGIEKHNELFKLTNELKTKMLMNNADVPMVRDNFAGYNIKSILCKRSINSKNPESKAKEVIIKNYS